MLQLGGVENSVALALKNHGFRTSLASKHMKKEQTRDMMKLYNKYAIKI
jgi:putative endopeptidase